MGGSHFSFLLYYVSPNKRKKRLQERPYGSIPWAPNIPFLFDQLCDHEHEVDRARRMKRIQEQKDHLIIIFSFILLFSCKRTMKRKKMIVIFPWIPIIGCCHLPVGRKEKGKETAN